MSLDLNSSKIIQLFKNKTKREVAVLHNGVMSEADVERLQSIISSKVGGVNYGVSHGYKDDTIEVPAGDGAKSLVNQNLWINRKSAIPVKVSGKMFIDAEKLKAMWSGITTWGGVQIESRTRDTITESI